MENYKNLCNAQIALVNKAVLLMQAGVDDHIRTTIYSALDELQFIFADVDLTFTRLHPYNEEELNAALAKLDEMIQQKKAEAEKVIQVLKNA